MKTRNNFYVYFVVAFIVGILIGFSVSLITKNKYNAQSAGEAASTGISQSGGGLTEGTKPIAQPTPGPCTGESSCHTADDCKYGYCDKKKCCEPKNAICKCENPPNCYCGYY